MIYALESKAQAPQKQQQRLGHSQKGKQQLAYRGKIYK